MSYNIKTEALLISNYQDKGWSMNGLDRYSFETLIYAPKNTFYIPSPKTSDINYNTWTLGWLDPKQMYFYETNYISEEPCNRIQNFDDFLEFLQIVLDKKIYANLFKEFCFDKGLLMNGDRFIYAAVFRKTIDGLEFARGKQEIVNLLCEMMKSSNKMISYSLLKKKITSNLKNFKTDLILSQSQKFDDSKSERISQNMSQSQYSNVNNQ